MIERFLKQTRFSSEEDYRQHLKFIIPENFNFAYDVIDAWAEEAPNKPALLWTDEHGKELRFTFKELKEQTDQAAAYYQSLGIGHGDKVMLILSEEDIMKNVRHEDASFATTWSIDLHYPDSVNQRQFPGRAFKADTRHQVLSQPYDVPYRCLYSRNVDNLFMAGRDISVTHVALGTTRVMRTCGMAGEVIGMAAHLCRKHGTLPRGVYRHHLGDLKALLAKGTGRPDAVFNQGYNAWNPWSRTNK